MGALPIVVQPATMTAKDAAMARTSSFFMERPLWYQWHMNTAALNRPIVPKRHSYRLFQKPSLLLRFIARRPYTEVDNAPALPAATVPRPPKRVPGTLAIPKRGAAPFTDNLGSLRLPARILASALPLN